MEIWKDVPDYEGYQVSSHGRVKSFKCNNPLIMRQCLDKYYYMVRLCNKGKYKKFRTHQLVAITFLDHKPCGHQLVIDHIDEDKTNNHVDNLRIVTNRFNASRKTNGTSKYVGVGWDKHCNKWKSQIWVNGKSKNLGSYKIELDAHEAYQKALKLINKTI